MPFKSEAQRRKFAQLVSEGKLPQSVFDAWNDITPSKIPERLAKRAPKIARSTPTPAQLRAGKRR